MPHPFDATMKHIVHLFASDYAEQFEFASSGPILPLNVDLSTVSAATDIALAEGDPPKSIFDLNFQASASEDLPRRVLLYHALLHHRYNVPVRSVIVLLRTAADHPSITGRIHYQTPPRKGKMDFRYGVVRMWRTPAKKLLVGRLGTLPLAVLGKLSSKRTLVESLRGIVEIIAARVSAEAEPPMADRLITGTIVMCGLRISKAEIQQLVKGTPIMKESTAYEAILEMGIEEGIEKGIEEGIEKGIEKGRIQEAKRILLGFGETQIGKPSNDVVDIIERIDDAALLEKLISELARAKDWSELVQILEK